ncbi:MAG: DUF4268 domain-containing protein [Bacteroidales bacterium]|nr:DUF4268 domain-containing protein [Bacteroidales bacterium]
MYTKEEVKLIRKKFWDHFETYTSKRNKTLRKKQKWILQKTGIKALSLKFDVTNNAAQVGIEIASKGIQRQLKYYEKLQSLKNLLDTEFEHELIWNDHYQLETGKEVFRIYLEKKGMSLFNEKDWTLLFDFFYTNMTKLETWFLEYKDILKMNEEEIFNDE